MESHIYCYTYTNVTVKKTFSPKERLLILENMLLILMLIIKSLSIRTTNIFFSNRSVGLNMHWLGGKGFGQIHRLLRFSKLLQNYCMFDLDFYVSKSKVLSQFPYSRNVMDFSSRSNYFFHYMVTFGDPYRFSLIIFIVSHCIGSVRVRSFLCSVFFRVRKFPYLCSFQGQCTFQLLALFTWKVNKIT